MFKYLAHCCSHSRRCLLFPIQFLWHIRLSPLSCLSPLCCLRHHFVSSDALSSHVYIVSLCSLACFSVSIFVSCCLVFSSGRSCVIHLSLYSWYSPRPSSCLLCFSQSEEFNGGYFLLCNWILKLQTLCLAVMSGSDCVFMWDLSFAFSVLRVLIIVGRCSSCSATSNLHFFKGQIRWAGIFSGLNFIITRKQNCSCKICSHTTIQEFGINRFLSKHVSFQHSWRMHYIDNVTVKTFMY